MKPETDDRFAIPEPGDLDTARTTQDGTGRPLGDAYRPDPQELLTAVAAGDIGAFGALYDLLAPRVFALIRGLVPDTAHAENVMREALVKVWRTAPGFDAGRYSAPAWVCAIAHHRAVLRARALRTAPPVGGCTMT